MLQIHWKVRAALNPPVSISQMTQALQTHLFCDSADFGFTFKPAVFFLMLSVFINLFSTHMSVVLKPWRLELDSAGTVRQGCGLCVLFKETKNGKELTGFCSIS